MNNKEGEGRGSSICLHNWTTLDEFFMVLSNLGILFFFFFYFFSFFFPLQLHLISQI